MLNNIKAAHVPLCNGGFAGSSSACELIFTLHAKLSGAVYCYQSCLCACNGWAGGVCLWVCYHNNSKLHASILTKLGL